MKLQLVSPCLSPEDELIRKDMSRAVRRAIQSLPAPEGQVIRYAFGIGRPELTMQEMSERSGNTYDAIRCMRDRALHALKHPSRSKVLRDLL